MNTDGDFGLRREAERHAAFARTKRAETSNPIIRPKAPSPLRFAGAVQDAARGDARPPTD